MRLDRLRECIKLCFENTGVFVFVHQYQFNFLLTVTGHAVIVHLTQFAYSSFCYTRYSKFAF